MKKTVSTEINKASFYICNFFKKTLYIAILDLQRFITKEFNKMQGAFANFRESSVF